MSDIVKDQFIKEKIDHLERLVSLAEHVLTHRLVGSDSGNKSLEARKKAYWKEREKDFK